MRNKKVDISGLVYDYVFCDTTELLLLVDPSRRKRLFISLSDTLSAYVKRKYDLSELVISAHKEKPKSVAYSILYHNNEIATMLRVIYNKREAYINMVITNRKFRRKGLCTKNLNMLITMMKEINEFSLMVETWNVNAIECYKKVGFKIDDKWKKDGKEWYRMVLKL